MSKAYYLIGSVTSFILFLIFTMMVRADKLRSFDFNMTVKLQDRIPLRADTFFSALSVLGRFEYTFAFLIIFLIFQRKLIGGIIVFSLFGFAHIIEIIGKSFLEQPGPPRMFLRSHFSDFPGLHVFTEASYPSGHSMRTLFLATLFILATHDSKRIPLIGKLVIYAVIGFLVVCILVSRVSLGEHWATDVIGGSLLGLSFGLLSYFFLQLNYSKMWKRSKKS